MNINKHWLKIFLISLLFTILTVVLIIFPTKKISTVENKNTITQLQNFENQILDIHADELTKQGYENVEYELNKIIQEMQKHNYVYRPAVDLNSDIKDTVIKKYNFYATYYKVIIDDKEYLFKNEDMCKNFINKIKQYTNENYKITTKRAIVNKENDEESLNNIIALKKEAYKKALAKAEAKRKAEEAARKKAKQAAAAKKNNNTASLSDYQKYARDLVINTYG